MLQFFVRERDTIKIFSVEEQATRPTPLDPQMQLPFPEVASWAPSGKQLALVDPSRGVMVILLSDDAGDIAVQPLPDSAASTKQLQWSTQSTFLVTLAPAQPDEPNMVVWNASATLPIGRFHFPRWREKHLWPAMKWSADELVCVRAEGNSLIVLDGQTLRSLQTLQTDAAPRAELALDCSDGYRFFVFSPEHRDTDLDRTLKAEGYLELVTWKDGAAAVERTCAIPSAETCEMEWSATGQWSLLHAHTDVDESGQNYYGASRLLVCSVGGVKLEITADAVNTGECVQLDETSPKAGAAPAQNVMLQAFAWSPTRDEFVLITGFQPAVATLWACSGTTCRKVWAFPERLHRNTIRWNRFGDLLALGGFGNLAGDLDFWHREAEGMVRCGSTKAECTVKCSWAPNGRHFLTAVLAPRMRVDNAVTVWRGLCGQAVHTQRFHELFEAVWKPLPSAPPLTPEEVQLARSSATKEQPAQRKAYRPPGARGAAADEPFSVAARMKSQQGIDDAITRRRGGAKSKGKGHEEIVGMQRADLGAKDGKAKDGKGKEKGEKEKGKRSQSPERFENGGGGGGGAGDLFRALDHLSSAQGPPADQHRPEPRPKPPKLPEQGWAYVDTAGKVQGPFALAEMRAWNQHGYFRPELQIRSREGEAFTALKDLYPKSEEAFMVPPGS